MSRMVDADVVIEYINSTKESIVGVYGPGTNLYDKALSNATRNEVREKIVQFIELIAEETNNG